MITAEQLAEWKKITEAATEGPWTYDTCYGVAFISAAKNKPIAHAVDYLVPDNATFIATARTAMPLLLAEVERLRDKLAAMREDS